MSAISPVRIPQNVLMDGQTPLVHPREPEREMENGRNFNTAYRATNTVHTAEELDEFILENPDFDLNSGGRCDWTLMATAIDSNNLVLGDALLQRDLSLIRKSTRGGSPYFCLATRSVEWVKLFVRYGGDTNICLADGITPLRTVSENEPFEDISKLKHLLHLARNGSLNDFAELKAWLQSPTGLSILCKTIEDLSEQEINTASASMRLNGLNNVSDALTKYKSSIGLSPTQDIAGKALKLSLEVFEPTEDFFQLIELIIKSLEKPVHVTKFLLLNGAVLYKTPLDTEIQRNTSYLGNEKFYQPGILNTIRKMELILPNIGFAISEIRQDYTTSFRRFQAVHLHTAQNFFSKLPSVLGQLIMDFTPLGQQQRQFLEACQLLKPYPRPGESTPVLANDEATRASMAPSSLNEGKAPAGIQGLDTPD